MRILETFLTSTGLALISAGFIASAPVPAQSQDRPILMAQQCSPLTDANFAACCAAENRADILTPAQIAQCPPLFTAAIAPTDPFSTTNAGGGGLGGGGGNGGGPGGGGGGNGGGGGGNDGGGGGNDGGGGGNGRRRGGATTAAAAATTAAAAAAATTAATTAAAAATTAATTAAVAAKITARAAKITARAARIGTGTTETSDRVARINAREPRTSATITSFRRADARASVPMTYEQVAPPHPIGATAPRCWKQRIAPEGGRKKEASGRFARPLALGRA